MSVDGAGREGRGGWAFAAMAVAGLAIRLTYVLTVLQVEEFGGDAFYYRQQANLLADGLGFIEPFKLAILDVRAPSAYHPPLYPLYLAAFSLFGADSTLSHQLASVALGTATVVVCGLTARRVAGHRAGLFAAAIAALYPGLWVSDGLLMSETPFALLVACSLLAACRLSEQPSRANAAILGAVLAAAALVRGEGLLLAAGMLAAGLVIGLRHVALKGRVGLVSLAGVVLIAGVSPWVVRNLTTFEHPVLLSTNAGPTIAAANCPSTYTGWARGYFDMKCWDVPNPEDESVADRFWRERGVEYARQNASQLPGVAAARVGRVWSLYKPIEMVVDLDPEEGRRWEIGFLGLVGYYLLVPAAVVGALSLRRGSPRRPLWPLVVPFPVVSLIAVVFYGVTRFRVSAEVALVVLGGIGAQAISAWVIARWRGEPASSGRSSES